MPRLPTAIVDSHHHLWNLQHIRYPWLADEYDAASFILGEYRPLCQDFLPKDFRASWGGMPVVGSTGEQFAARLREDIEGWTPIVKAGKFTGD